MKWIPIKQELPRCSGEYIATIEGAVKATTLFYNALHNTWHGSLYSDCNDVYRPIAWMPLPAAYKEAENE